MIIIPNRQSKKINQNNRSKILGDIWASFNLDLQSDLGLVKVSPRLQVNTKDVANQGLSVAFSAYDNNIFTVAGTRIFKSSAKNLISAFTEDASSGAITDYNVNYSDMTHFNNLLFTSSQSKIMSKAQDGSGTGAWTSRYSLTTSNCNHKLCYMSGTDRLYFIDDYNSIKSMDKTSYSTATFGSYFISIPYDMGGTLYTMINDKTNIWIGTTFLNSTGGLDTLQHASILVWDGISATATSEYKIKAKGVLALSKDDNGIIYAIDSNGALLRFNGSGFAEIDRLPLNKKYLTNAIPDGNGNFDSFIHPNGFYFTRNGTFIVLINNLIGDNGSTIKENLSSGIWEWSKDTGFVHRQSTSYNPMATSTITDYGQNRVSAVGALYEANIYSTDVTGKPMLICGVQHYTDSSTVSTAILIDDPLDNIQKYGYFVTSWIQSQNLKDNWQKIALKYRKLLNNADKIWVKYRLTEVSATEFTLTWVNTTSFTTTTDLSACVGYEVEVLQGTGSGKCAHITAVTNNAGTYTVTLDETFTGVTTGTAKARYQAWIKTATVADQLTESLIKGIASAASERIQLKVCMQFTGDNELHEVILINNAQSSLQ